MPVDEKQHSFDFGNLKKTCKIMLKYNIQYSKQKLLGFLEGSEE